MKTIITLLIFTGALLYGNTVRCQSTESNPPLIKTRWSQDPLGIRPLELSTAFGFVWGSLAVATSLILAKKDSSFRKRLFMYNETGWSEGYRPPYTRALQNEVGLMFQVRNWLKLGMGVNAYHFSDRINNTWNFGFRPFARWYPYRTKNLLLFFEYGAGLSYNLERFPIVETGWHADSLRAGTKFNFTTKYGAGAEIRINRKYSLQGGVRHTHLSNGNTSGVWRNPAHDSNGFFLGLNLSLN